MANPASFHDVRFPVAVSLGVSGGPERRNEIVQLTSGAERRNARFSQSRRRYDAGTGIRSLDNLYDVLAFFEARRGSFHAFRLRDPFDMSSCRPGGTPTAFDQEIGVGDGSRRRFAIVKIYGTGSDAYRRAIAKPVAGSVTVAVDGVEKANPADFTIDAATGEVVFAVAATPASGKTVTAGYEFDVPVRFDIEHLALNLTAFKAGQIHTIPLVEVKP